MTIACESSFFLTLETIIFYYFVSHFVHGKMFSKLLLLGVCFLNKSSFKYQLQKFFFSQICRIQISVSYEVRLSCLRTAVSGLQHILNNYLCSFIVSHILCFGFLWIFLFPFHCSTLDIFFWTIVFQITNSLFSWVYSINPSITF